MRQDCPIPMNAHTDCWREELLMTTYPLNRAQHAQVAAHTIVIVVGVTRLNGQLFTAFDQAHKETKPVRVAALQNHDGL